MALSTRAWNPTEKPPGVSATAQHDRCDASLSSLGCDSSQGIALLAAAVAAAAADAVQPAVAA